MDKMKDNFMSFIIKFQDAYHVFLADVALYAWKAFLAVLLVVIGFQIVKFIQEVIYELIEKIKLDNLLKKIDIDKYVEKTGYKLNSAKFISVLIKWMLLIAIFLAALQILGLTIVITFAMELLAIVGKIIIAIAILGVAVLASKFVSRIANGAAKVLKLKSGEIIAKIASGIIYLIAVITILGMFEITEPLLRSLEIIITGLVLGVALAFGLAFGLGGREKAKDIIEKIKNKNDD